MKQYEIMIEGVFIKIPELGFEVGGFHTTFYLDAYTAVSAVHRVKEVLATRIARGGIAENKCGALRTYYWVHDIWEISEEKFTMCERMSLGFTFFRIGWLERIYLVARGAFFRRYKPWLMIGPFCQ